MIFSRFKLFNRKQFSAILKQKFQWISSCKSKVTKQWNQWILKIIQLKSSKLSIKFKTHKKTVAKPVLEIEGGCLGRRFENMVWEVHHLTIRVRYRFCQRIWWVIILWLTRKPTLYNKETSMESQQISNSPTKPKSASKSCSIRSKNKLRKCFYRRPKLQQSLLSAIL